MPPQRVGTCETAGATVTRNEAWTALPVTGMKKVRASPRAPRPATMSQKLQLCHAESVDPRATAPSSSATSALPLWEHLRGGVPRLTETDEHSPAEDVRGTRRLRWMSARRPSATRGGSRI